MTATPPICDRIPPTWGGPLNGADYALLNGSWITRALADQAMLRRVDSQEGREVIGHKGKRDCAGILIPYYWPGEAAPVNYRVRRDRPELVQDKSGALKPDGRYLGAPGGGNHLYIPPGTTPEQLADVKIPIVVVEGEKKALALQRLANHETNQPRFIPLGVAGVWNWRGTVGKTGGPKGERVDVKGPIADLSRVAWNGRTVFIVFDANVHTNESVKWARKGIARELATRGAVVKFVNLPEDCGLNGIDDLLAAWGPAQVLALFERSVSGANLQVVQTPQFQSRTEGMFRVTTKGEQSSEVQLTSYKAAIVTSIRLDDGVESKSEFEIESELMGRAYRCTIPAAEFAGMDWPIKMMGPAAITYPTQREYARTAIQSFSLAAEERCIYTHTGWRQLNGRWCYLHAGGAIAESGPIENVEVRMGGSLAHYRLRLPENPDALAVAVRASLCLAELGPPCVGFPLLAAVYRAVLGDADFAVHLAGETGAFKSELAALYQQHFGSGMDRLHLPGSWSSTGNALEALAFHAKDALLVIDDFAPQGTANDVARYHAAADRVFRAAGNRAGRSRLDSTAKLREAKPPRALILSTGEDVPRGHSIRARLLILEIAIGAIKSDRLTECQKDAQSGMYAEAMTGFLRWLAPNYENLSPSFRQSVSEYRAAARQNAGHARTPEIVSNLKAGFERFLAFAKDCGAISGAERDALSSKCWAALVDSAAAQAKHHAATEPTRQFIATLRTLLTSGRAHLAALGGGQPEWAPGSCGWRRDGDRCAAHGDRIGWVDCENVYLDGKAAYRLVQAAGRDSGDVLAVSEQTLRKRLREKSLLASVDQNRGTLTIRKRIEGSSKDVLHFHRSVLLPDEPDDPSARGEAGE
jgi:hypothetical protein